MEDPAGLQRNKEIQPAHWNFLKSVNQFIYELGTIDISKKR